MSQSSLQPTRESSLQPTRREAIQTAGVLTASTLAGVAIPAVHAAGDEEIQVALIGCGGRGTGAAENALRTTGPVKLVAMVDVFKDRLENSYRSLKSGFDKQVTVTPDKKFIGFDGYKQAMDSLRKGDVVILTTPPAFRWVHFQYAIEKGLNVFMEKPTTVDGPSSRKMLELADKSEKAGLKVGVGLMCRHCDARKALYEQIKAGRIGDLTFLRAYRVVGLTGSAATGPKPKGISELLYQVRNFHGFLWLSGGAFSDFLIHNIDECCWMKDAWPVEAKALGGRHYRDNCVDQNFDVYSVEYTFADGTKLFLEGRNINGCHQEFASYAHGTKGSAIISTSAHTPARSRIFAGHDMKAKPVWSYPKRERNPYQLEWDFLMDAIRNGKPFNEAKRGAEASLVTVMGRLAAHTGHVWTYKQTLEHEHEFAPNVDKLTLDGPSPLQADAQGRYPVPEPGRKTKREY